MRSKQADQNQNRIKMHMDAPFPSKKLPLYCTFFSEKKLRIFLHSRGRYRMKLIRNIGMLYRYSTKLRTHVKSPS